jgi:hypothetical protein
MEIAQKGKHMHISWKKASRQWLREMKEIQEPYWLALPAPVQVWDSPDDTTQSYIPETPIQQRHAYGREDEKWVRKRHVECQTRSLLRSCSWFKILSSVTHQVFFSRSFCTWFGSISREISLWTRNQPEDQLGRTQGLNLDNDWNRMYTINKAITKHGIWTCSGFRVWCKSPNDHMFWPGAKSAQFFFSNI